MRAGSFPSRAWEKAIFDNVAVGYDNNADDTIDYYVINETFGGTSITPTHDYAGNLTYDGTYRYTYDAWNRLVKATLNDTNVEVQAAVYDGLGRRVKKVVTNSGTHDGISWYYYDRNQIIETHDGNGKLINQVYHGTQYIDEIVAMRTEYGRVYVHQAEGDQCGSLKDWNVIGLSDVTGRVLERYYYSPYGELEVVRDAHFFDYDDDGDVDDDDETAFTACIGETSGDCLRFDADCDGEVTEVDDGEEFGYYTATLTADTELQRIPATTVSTMGNPFGHQGLAFDVEIGSYQNRHRQYAPKMKRFMQRDPLGTRPVVRKPWSTSRDPALDPRGRVVQPYADGMNLYEDVKSNPTTDTDPSGLRVRMRGYIVGGDDRGTIGTTIHVDIWPPPCCRLVRFVQRVREQTWRFGYSDSGWVPDSGSGLWWYDHVSGPDTLAGGGKRWTLTDYPGKGSGDFTLQGLRQDFETCALCISGSGLSGTKSCLLGCMDWGHNWVRGNPDYHRWWGPTSRGGPSVGMQMFIGSTYFPSTKRCQ